MEDFTGLILKKINNKITKEKFILYILKNKWSSIVGVVAAKHTQPYKLEENTLLIHTDNAAWSHNLLMLKRQIVSKLTEFIPIEAGKKRPYKVKDLRFYHGRIQDEVIYEQEKVNFIPKLDPKRRCPCCGVMLMDNEEICSCCQRKQKAEERSKIHKILSEAPWFDYKDCVNYLKCDKITFMGVKADYQEVAKERALDVKAKESEKYFAVMLVLGKTPEEVTNELIAKSLKSWKRSREYVSTPRKQLSGEK